MNTGRLSHSAMKHVHEMQKLKTGVQTRSQRVALVAAEDIKAARLAESSNPLKLPSVIGEKLHLPNLATPLSNPVAVSMISTVLRQ